ncbi:BTB POZ domain-containing protein [Musa troglodytarum]|uniref:BTB POZ domain-containing protein n=1 Tax=Musa troglodytarum TaxID=320322 RepID=A0A9E7HMQ0_9LILI|nr:BTB POZ domain-containing protein [Musa troglodytarum]
MKSKGLKQETVSKILINYAQSSLQGLTARDVQSSKGGFSDADMLRQQKIMVETIVGLLPSQSRRSPVPMAFLSGLLKTATMVSASTICRADLERRIGLQLDQAILEDILIPAANAHGGCQSSLYDTESVARIFSIFLNLEEDEEDGGRLREDRDGCYVHPNLKDSERYRLCKTIDCQKLSQEACSHAAQNERLPIQMAVQVLYLEQIRLRNVINGGHDQFFFGSAIGQCAQRSGSGVGSGAISPRDNYASVRRENRELKLEVARMRIRLTDLEKDHVSMKQELVRANPANKLLRSFTKNLSKLSALFRMRRVEVKPLSAKAASDARLLFQKRRRQALW